MSVIQPYFQTRIFSRPVVATRDKKIFVWATNCYIRFRYGLVKIVVAMVIRRVHKHIVGTMLSQAWHFIFDRILFKLAITRTGIISRASSNSDLIGLFDGSYTRP